MGKQHPLYRVKWAEINQQYVQESKNALISYNTKKTQKPTSIHENFYVNSLIFIHSKTGKINFLSVKSLKLKGTTSFIKVLEEIKTIYDTRGFMITDYHGDNEFNIKE